MNIGNTACHSSTILDNMPVGVMLVGSDFTVISWNKTLEKWTGIPQNDIIGNTLTSFFPNLNIPTDLEQIEQLFRIECALKDFSEQLANLIQKSDTNEEYPQLHANIAPIILGENNHILVTLQNKTELIKFSKASEDISVQTNLSLIQKNKSEDQRQLAESVFSSTSIGILVTDSRGVILSVNPAFEEITGYFEADAVGGTPRFLKSGIHDPTYYSQILNTVFREGEWKGEIWVRRKNGEIFPQDTTITAIRDKNGAVRKYSAIISDVTERKKEEEQLRFLSMRDGLTGLFNRRTFDEELKNEWRRALRVSAPFSLVILDIDHFKPYNDTYGHHQGDLCLKAVAEVISGSVHRKGDLTARYGGEEFIILLPSSSKNDALFIAEAIRVKITELSIDHKNSISEKTVTVSLGVGTLVPSLKNSPDKLFHLADKALYAAKSQGRNRVVSYVEEGGQLQLLQ